MSFSRQPGGWGFPRKDDGDASSREFPPPDGTGEKNPATGVPATGQPSNSPVPNGSTGSALSQKLGSLSQPRANLSNGETNALSMRTRKAVMAEEDPYQDMKSLIHRR